MRYNFKASDSIVIWREDGGENLFSAKGPNYKDPKVAAVKAVDMWYDEIKDYDYGDPLKTPLPDKPVGHFTQVVWKMSMYIGVGYAFDTQGAIYVVVLYNPGGNELSLQRYTQNVMPLKKESPKNGMNRGGELPILTTKFTLFYLLFLFLNSLLRHY